MKYTIEKLDHYGRGIVREDVPIFVEDALPNEIVEIKITNSKKKYKEAIVTKIVEESKDRRKPICPYFEECGGCNLMHLPYLKTLEFKENKVKEILQKFYDKAVFIKPIIFGNELYYRNKVTLKVKENIGYYKKNTYDLVSVDECFIADKKINEIIKDCYKLPLQSIEEIVIRSSHFNKDTLAFIKLKNDIDKEKCIEILKENVNSIILSKEKEEVIYGKGYIIEKIKDFEFKISPNSFFQVNSNMMIKLYEKVLEYLNPKGNEKVLDYYSGTGTIGIFVSPYVKEVVGVEISESSYKDALENMKNNNIENIKFYCQNANTFKEKDFDAVILDPPRSGLDDKTRNHLKEIKTEKMVYVSCDPVTLARDLKDLSEIYDVLEVTPVDMFPYTYHVECVSLLNLKINEK